MFIFRVMAYFLLSLSKPTKTEWESNAHFGATQNNKNNDHARYYPTLKLIVLILLYFLIILCLFVNFMK